MAPSGVTNLGWASVLIATSSLSSTTMNGAAHDRARAMPLLVGAVVATLDSFTDLDRFVESLPSTRQ